MRIRNRTELLTRSPEWWQIEGAGIEVKDIKPDSVYLASQAVRLTVTHIPVERQKGGRAWLLEGTIFTSPRHRNKVEVDLETDWLRGIFCGIVIMPTSKKLFHVNFTAAVDGIFIRFEDFASILAPHSRGYVSPVLSVLVTHEMTAVMNHLIQQNSEG